MHAGRRGGDRVQDRAHHDNSDRFAVETAPDCDLDLQRSTARAGECGRSSQTPGGWPPKGRAAHLRQGGPLPG